MTTPMATSGPPVLPSRAPVATITAPNTTPTTTAAPRARREAGSAVVAGAWVRRTTNGSPTTDRATHSTRM